MKLIAFVQKILSLLIFLEELAAIWVNRLPDSNLLKKWWRAYFGFIIIGITFLLYPMANYFIAEDWVETPPLSEILNENNKALQELSITEIEIGTMSWLLEYKGGKFVETNGHGNVFDGYELETNREDFYITKVSLLRGFRASYSNGKWLAEVPISVTSNDVGVAKKQVAHLVTSIDNHFKKQKEVKGTW